MAVQRNDLEMVKMLLKFGARVNFPAGTSETFLKYAEGFE